MSSWLDNLFRFRKPAPVVTSVTDLNKSYDLIMGALTVWKEARGEPLEGKRAVYHVILNRMKAGWGATVLQVVTARYQFSCWNADDPNVNKFPDAKDPSWLECLEVILNPGEDNTQGAKHYFNPKIVTPSWSLKMVLSLKIGNHAFYRDA
jgi:spore germination cell wall hydrolase CwlJ-like protein